MKEITVRELRNNGSAVINRVLSGESLIRYINGPPT
jgi:antitoxin (DNA-binding transcriptional repressor) of toxin-antitoxin stability system